MYELREADIQLEMKERLLTTLGHAVRRMNVDNHNIGKFVLRANANIVRLYQQYLHKVSRD